MTLTLRNRAVAMAVVLVAALGLMAECEDPGPPGGGGWKSMPATATK